MKKNLFLKLKNKIFYHNPPNFIQPSVQTPDMYPDMAHYPFITVKLLEMHEVHVNLSAQDEQGYGLFLKI